MKAVQEFRVPTNAKSVREFLGIPGYYQCFIPNFAKVASSIVLPDTERHTICLCQGAFEKLKDLLTSPPALAYPDFDKPFVLHTGASGNGLGAVLEQEQGDDHLHPMVYASRTLSKHEKLYGITDMEALWAAKNFRASTYSQLHCFY